MYYGFSCLPRVQSRLMYVRSALAYKLVYLGLYNNSPQFIIDTLEYVYYGYAYEYAYIPESSYSIRNELKKLTEADFQTMCTRQMAQLFFLP